MASSDDRPPGTSPPSPGERDDDDQAGPGESHVVRRRWPLVAARGVVSLLLGVVALVWEGIDEASLLLAFGVFGVVAGVLLLVDAVRIAGPQRPLLAAEGVVAAVAGLVALVWPSPTLAVAVVLVGAWAVASGVLETAAALAQRSQATATYVPVLAGVAAVAVGVLLFVRRDLDLPAVAVMFGAYAAVAGGLLISSALRLRQMAKD